MDTTKCPFCLAEIDKNALKCKHCGEWVKERKRKYKDRDDRVVCPSCGKKMIPRIITGPPVVRPSGGWTPVPKKSICPFCGETYQTFPMSLGEKIGLVFFIIFIIFFIFDWMKN